MSLFEHLNIVHLLLALSGLAVHILMKLAETPGPLLSGFTKKDILVSFASLIAIPAILLMCTDTGMKELLPINYLTAFLAGYQTQSFLRSASSILGKKNQ